MRIKDESSRTAILIACGSLIIFSGVFPKLNHVLELSETFVQLRTAKLSRCPDANVPLREDLLVNAGSVQANRGEN